MACLNLVQFSRCFKSVSVVDDGVLLSLRFVPLNPTLGNIPGVLLHGMGSNFI